MRHGVGPVVVIGDGGLVGEQVRDERAGHPRFRVLPRAVDRHDHRVVGEGVEDLRELGGEHAGAAVQVGLEDGDEAAVPDGTSRRGERRTYLGRVVGEVVVDAHSPDLATQLEPALGASEGGDPVEGASGVEPEPREHGEGTGGIERVVHAGDPERHGVVLASEADHERDGGGRVERVYEDIRPLGLAEGDDPGGGQPAGDGDGARVVARDRDEFPRTVGERDEGILEGRGGAVMVEVVRVHVRDESDAGVVEEEGAVRLVRLDDEEVVGADGRARPE